MKIIGISCFFHDSAAALIIDSEIVTAVQEGRFTREEHASKFPLKSIEFLLEDTGLKINEIDSFVFYDKTIKMTEF
tara:strand:+ start:5325 stop:5552 length:228 start_codon:yes stop_codon:yes gene_type:complete